MDSAAWAAHWTARYNRPPRQAVADLTPELRAAWRTRYCPDADVELRAPSLAEGTAKVILLIVL